MRTLHDIQPNTAKAIWFMLRGRNGRYLDDRTAHIAMFERGTPPPIPRTPDDWNARWLRTGWIPYSHLARNHPAPTPLCGPIKTKSIQPTVVFPQDNRWPPFNFCPRCRHISPAEFFQEVRFNDPWNHAEHLNAPDPISGV